ncbi:hypothetical protein [Roseomonas chloroacetimidivorans]|uniref:hypothetical protein n=1 Tax=Roseomonas chloroacetimidivorans TaxID=1766656 RepID=UPI003C77F42B
MFAVLPAGWFPPTLGDAPVLRAVLSMAGRIGAWAYSFLDYTRQQMRIGTASGGWLDLVALDFFGARLRRRAGQSDAALRTRILAEVLRPRATRAAMRQLLLDLTGREPRIIEPARPQDLGGYGMPRLGYGVAGAYGSLRTPGAVFIDVYRDLTTGAPNIAGYGISTGGYGVGRSAYLGADQAADAITDDDILEAIVANKPEGVTAWVRIQA